MRKCCVMEMGCEDLSYKYETNNIRLTLPQFAPLSKSWTGVVLERILSVKVNVNR